MIIELLVGAGLVTLGVVAVRALRRRDDGDDEAPEQGGARPERAGTPAVHEPGDDRGDPAPTAAPPPIRPASPRGLRVDDVLLYADEELWLACEIHLDEEGFALSLFRTPGSTRCAWVAQLDAEAREVALLTPTDEVPGGAVPTELPIGGVRLSLRRRGHADVRTAGEQLPPTTERARYALLGGPGGRTLVVVDFDGGDRIALAGERIGREMLDLLAGGEAG